MPFLGKCFDKLPDFFQIHFAILKNGQDIEYCHVLRVSVILQKKNKRSSTQQRIYGEKRNISSNGQSENYENKMLTTFKP